MTSPTIDGKAQVIFSSASSHSITLTTTLTNDIICVCVSFELAGTQRSVSSVTATGLTFTKYKQLVSTSGADFNTIEVWTAPASAAFSGSITVNLSGNIDDACIVAFGVNGTSTGSPFDPNAGLPASAGPSSGVPTVTFSTTNANDLLIAVTSGVTNEGGVGAATGWTNVGNPNNVGGSLENTQIVDSKSVSSAQSGATYASAATNVGANWISLVFAFSEGGNTESGIAVFTLNQLTFAGNAAFTESGTGVFTLNQFLFTAASTVAKAAQGIITLAQFLFFGAALDAPPAGKGKRHFWTFGA